MVRSRDEKIIEKLAYIVMFIVGVIVIVPFIILFVSSITDETTLLREGYSLIPRKFSLEAYSYIWDSRDTIFRAYLVTIVITFIGTLVSVIITAMIAYPLSLNYLPGKKILAFIVLFTMLFNGGLVPTYIMWTQTFHIKNTLFAYLVPNLLMSAFYVIMTRTYLTTNIPKEMIEAAKMDGAGEFRVLGRIILPMSKPILSTIGLLVGLAYWNDWLNGLYYINKDALYSIQVLLNKMLLDTQFLMSSASQGMNIDTTAIPSTGIKMAIAVMGILPVLVIYPFLQKYLVKGITIGAVKG